MIVAQSSTVSCPVEVSPEAEIMQSQHQKSDSSLTIVMQKPRSSGCFAMCLGCLASN
jgi:hypothetical protein